jgi:hypothetical protein
MLSLTIPTHVSENRAVIRDRHAADTQRARALTG